MQFFVQQSIISAYEDSCPLKPAKTGRHSLQWTSELQFLRRGAKLLFNKCRTDKNPQSWEFYTGAQRRYSKEVRKTSKEAWMTFCSSVNDLLMLARLYRALSRNPKIKLGSLVALLGRCMQSEGETFQLLLTTHFPNLEVTKDVAAQLLSALPDVVTGRWL